MSKLLLIDGHSILNRAFYGLPDLHTYKRYVWLFKYNVQIYR